MPHNETVSPATAIPERLLPEYSSGALEELQKIHLLSDLDEYGAILPFLSSDNLPYPVARPTYPPATEAVAVVPILGLSFLNQANQSLMRCADEAELVDCLLGSVRNLSVAVQTDVWLYDPGTRRLKRSRKSAIIPAPPNTIEAVFATGETRRGDFPADKTEVFYLCVLLTSGKSIYGVCYLSSNARPFSREELEMMTAIGHQAGAVLESLHLMAEQERACENVINALTLTIDARDEITAGHSGRVASYSASIALYMNLSQREQRLAYYAGLLHDYGKIGVRDEVLCKPTKLTEAEFAEIKLHPEFTLSILSKIKFSASLVDVPHVASCHHERPDGKGYPHGLKHSEIPIGALIIAVADVFDALTVKRHYRDPMPLDEVLEVIEKGRDTQLDGTVIDAFMRFYDQEYLPRQQRTQK